MLRLTCFRICDSPVILGRLVNVFEIQSSPRHSHAKSKVPGGKVLHVRRGSRRNSISLASAAVNVVQFKTEKKASSDDVVSPWPKGRPQVGTKTSNERSTKVPFESRSDSTIASISSVDELEGSSNVESVADRLWHRVGSFDGDYSKRMKEVYLPLSKFRLTTLVVLTAIEGYGMAPCSFAFDPVAFTSLLVGTTLTSACANSINQILEWPYDSQMSRTKNRPLVRGLISPAHAATFALATGTSGVLMLCLGANPLTGALGLANICLYAGVYTPLKRLSVANTWVGSLVGAIPPAMGWAACTGSLDAGAGVLAALLFCWQFPHFKALSWNLRADYSRAGYRMSSVVAPGLCRRACLRHSAAMLPLCALAPALGVTSWWFVVDSLPFNLYLLLLSYRFFRDGSSSSSRRLFRFSLIHIPVLLLLMILSKSRSSEAAPVPAPAPAPAPSEG